MGEDRERSQRRSGLSGKPGWNGNWNFYISMSPPARVVSKAFGEAASDFKGYRAAFARIAPKIIDGIHRIVASRGGGVVNGRGDPEPSAWESLKDKYYLRRKSKKGETRAMYFSDVLVSSVDTLSVTDRSVRVGTRIPYAVPRQYGRGGHKEGKRIFVALDATSWAQAVEELAAENSAKFARLADKLSRSA